MTKRISSFFLAFIMAIPIFSVTVYADGYTPYIDLKANGYVLIDSTVYTDFGGSVAKAAGYRLVQFPVAFTGRDAYVEILVESTQALNIRHEGTRTYLTRASLGTNLYLFSGSVGSSTNEIFRFVNNSSTTANFVIHKARYYPSVSNSQVALFTTNITWYMETFSSEAASSISVDRLPQDICAIIAADANGEAYGTSARVSEVYTKLSFPASELQGYDFLSIDFYTQDWALESMACEVNNQPLDVQLSGFNVSEVDMSVYGTGWTYGKNRYVLDIDLRSIPYGNTDTLDVYIQGVMNVQASDNEGPFIQGRFYFIVNQAKKYITLEQPEPQLGLLANIWQSIRDLSSNLLRLFEDNEEIIDDFRDEQAKDETKVDEFIDVIETTPTVNLDDVDDLVKPLDDLEIDTNYTTVLAGTLDGDFGTYLILFPVILAVIGYILYGKR